MSKFLITNNNIPYDNSYKHVIKFNNETERDNYINNNLIENYKAVLNAQPNTNQKISNPIYNTITIGYPEELILNKNYIIIQDVKGNITYHFINRMQDIGNNNKWTLDIELDIFMTHYTWHNFLMNQNLIKGHSSDYQDVEFDLPKEILNIQSVQKLSQETIYNRLDVPYLYVFEKITDASEGLLKYDKNLNQYREGFKVYIAPLKPIPLQNSVTTEDIQVWTGTEKLQVNKSDSATLTFYQPLEENYTYHFTTGTVNPNAISTPDYPQVDTYIKGDKFPQEIGESKFLVFNGLPSDQNTLGDDAETLNQAYFEDGDLTSTKHNYIGSGNQVISGQLFFHYMLSSISTANHIITSLHIMKVTKMDATNYKFEVPTSNEIQAFAGSSYWLSVRVDDYTFFETTYEYSYLDDTDEPYGTAVHTDGYSGSMDAQFILKNITRYKEDSNWNSQELLDFLTNTKFNTNIITAKISNYNPLKYNATYLSDTDLIFDHVDNISYVTKTYEDTENSVTYTLDLWQLNSVDLRTSHLANIYKINIDQDLNYKIKGLFPYGLAIENQLDIDLNPAYLINNQYFLFEHYASITPEWEERIKFLNPGYLELTNSDNLWSNDKEFSVSTDAFEEYKANNPVSSKLNPLKDIGKVITGGLKGAIFGGFWKGATAGVLGGLNNVISRQDIKQQPNKVTGSGDILGDVIFNYNSVNFVLLYYKFLGQSGKYTIENIKREGVTYPTGFYFTNYSIIERPYYNFISIENIYNGNFEIEVAKEVKDKFNSTFQNGVTIWNNWRTYKDFEVDNEVI